MEGISEITFSPITDTERETIVDLFNYYIEHSFAAFPDQKSPV